MDLYGGYLALKPAQRRLKHPSFVIRQRRRAGSGPAQPAQRRAGVIHGPEGLVGFRGNPARFWAGARLEPGEVSPRVPRDRELFLIGKRQDHRHDRLDLRRGQFLLPGREKQRHLQPHRQAAKVIRRRRGDLSGLHKRKNRSIQATQKRQALRDPPHLAVEPLRYRLQFQALPLVKILDQQRLLVEVHRPTAAVQLQHPGLGLPAGPVLDHRRDRLGTLGRRGRQTLEPVDHLERRALGDDGDRFGYTRAEPPPGLHRRTLQVRQARTDPPEGNLRQSHADLA